MKISLKEMHTLKQVKTRALKMGSSKGIQNAELDIARQTSGHNLPPEQCTLGEHI